MVMQASSHNS